jgi:hypothetical protein
VATIAALAPEPKIADVPTVAPRLPRTDRRRPARRRRCAGDAPRPISRTKEERHRQRREAVDRAVQVLVQHRQRS